MANGTAAFAKPQAAISQELQLRFPLVASKLSQLQRCRILRHFERPHSIFADVEMALSAVDAIHSASAFGEFAFKLQINPPMIFQPC